MLPKTMSASAFKTASGCLARFKAEYIQRGRTPGSTAADLGTSCHLALEMYVTETVMNNRQPQSVSVLMSCYTMAYLQTTGDFDLASDTYKDGEEMMRRWHARQDFEGIEVLSCEVKDHFELPYKLPDGTVQKMRINYICDRVDRVGDTYVDCPCATKCPEEIRVVDYKTWRGLIAANEVKGDLQAKMYALAYRIRFPHAKRIWVIIDQTRGEEVGTCFTEQDNIEDFKSIKMLLQGIIDTPADKARETINDECRWCVRKAACGALRAHDEVGGILNKGLDELMTLHYELTASNSARDVLLEDVKKQINAAMDDIGLTNLKSLDGEYELNTGGVRGGRRDVRPDLYVKIVGPDIALETAKFGIKKIDALEFDPRVSSEQWKAIENCITVSPGKRQVIVKKLKPKEE